VFLSVLVCYFLWSEKWWVWGQTVWHVWCWQVASVTFPSCCRQCSLEPRDNMQNNDKEPKNSLSITVISAWCYWGVAVEPWQHAGLNSSWCHVLLFVLELPQHSSWLKVMERMRQSIGCRLSKFQSVLSNGKPEREGEREREREKARERPGFSITNLVRAIHSRYESN